MLDNNFLDGLFDRFRSIVREEIAAAQPVKRDDKLLSRQEAADYLKISITTLGEWTKRGTLKCKQIGRRVLYAQSDLTKALR